MIQIDSSILSLDVSTSIIGWAILKDVGTAQLTSYGIIDLRKVGNNHNDNSLFIKTQYANNFIKSLLKINNIEQIWIEEALESVSNSSHSTAILNRYNAMLSYAIYLETGAAPYYINPIAARNMLHIPISIRMERPEIKETVYQWIIEKFPILMNKDLDIGKYDISDAIVVGLAGMEYN